MAKKQSGAKQITVTGTWLTDTHAPEPTYLNGLTEDIRPIASRWFLTYWEYQSLNLGPAFVEINQEGKGKMIYDINTDFFAGMLGGSFYLGYDVVFLLSDQQFYFYEPYLEAYTPTTPGKMKLLASKIMMDCLRDMPLGYDIRPILEFRSDSVLEEIVSKAKDLLAVTDGFFEGNDAPVRIPMGDDRNAGSIDEFIEQNVVASPEGILFLSDLLQEYLQFCVDNGCVVAGKAGTTTVMRSQLWDRFKVKMRNDVLAPNGKQNRAWKGLALLSQNSGAIALGFGGQSELSGQSGNGQLMIENVVEVALDPPPEEMQQKAA